MDTRKEWKDFYQRPAGISEYLENLSVQREFLEEISSRQSGKVLEVGCGSGTMSVFLSHLGFKAIAIDRDEEVLERARRASKDLNGEVDFIRADAFKLPFADKEFDIAFSQGVLEHFDDEDIVKLLKEQCRVAGCVFLSVPNNFYNHRDFGDERLLSKAEWEKILSGFNIAKSKDYYHIRARRNFLIERAVMYMAEIR
ncbi:MAG: methyltransferase domain-containing protein [Candidatus Omnitrophica bacterium]|nr:methyltransferase domain-containing protein [Candidatus Omnitrophota bacterium]